MLHVVGAVIVMALPFTTSMSSARADNVSSLLGLVNNLRTARGVPGLAADPALTSAAQQWSAHMASTGTLAHNPSLPSQVPSGWSRLGENVGDGGSVTAVFNALVAEPAHLANMIEPSYNLAGFAVVAGAGGTLWITQDFEARGAAPQPPTPPPVTPAPVTPAPVTHSPPTAARPAAATPATPATPAAPRPAVTPPPTSAPVTQAIPSTAATVTSVDPPAEDPTVAAVVPASPGLRSQALGPVVARTGGDDGRTRWALLAAVTLVGALIVAVGLRRRVGRLS
jgi:hypothetical protein